MPLSDVKSIDIERESVRNETLSATFEIWLQPGCINHVRCNDISSLLFENVDTIPYERNHAYVETYFNSFFLSLPPSLSPYFPVFLELFN